MPVVLSIGSVGLEVLKEIPVYPFGLTIGLGAIGSGHVSLDSQHLVKLRCEAAIELRPSIGDNFLWDSMHSNHRVQQQSSKSPRRDV